jgi:signal transduction histidine kinase
LQQFIIGLVIGISAVVPVLVFVLRCKAMKANKGRKGFQKQIEEISRLTGGLAHEIKNPLSTIKINLKLISEDLDRRKSDSSRKTPESALRKISVVQKEADRLEQILEGFLRYIDKREPNLYAMDINTLVSDMVDFYSPQSQSNSITLRSAFCDEPLICKVDPDMLKQVLLNLFLNAHQAMPRGGELMVQTSRQGQDALIRISDTGVGIEPERIERVFDAYYSTRPQGSGLGLPTAKKIVESHNGTISVTSKPGKGTSFAIKLPLQK